MSITAPWWNNATKRVNIAIAASGDTTLVAAVTGKKVRVLSISFIMGAANNIYFTSGAGGTSICGSSAAKLSFAINGGLSLGFNPDGYFETVAGAALVVNCSSTGPMAGCLTYEEAD